MRLRLVVVFFAFAATALAFSVSPENTQLSEAKLIGAQPAILVPSPGAQTAAAADTADCTKTIDAYEDKGIKIGIVVPCKVVDGATLSPGSPTGQQDKKLLDVAKTGQLGTKNECVEKSVTVKDALHVTVEEEKYLTGCNPAPPCDPGTAGHTTINGGTPISNCESGADVTTAALKAGGALTTGSLAPGTSAFTFDTKFPSLSGDLTSPLELTSTQGGTGIASAGAGSSGGSLPSETSWASLEPEVFGGEGTAGGIAGGSEGGTSGGTVGATVQANANQQSSSGWGMVVGTLMAQQLMTGLFNAPSGGNTSPSAPVQQQPSAVPPIGTPPAPSVAQLQPQQGTQPGGSGDIIDTLARLAQATGNAIGGGLGVVHDAIFTPAPAALPPSPSGGSTGVAVRKTFDSKVTGGQVTVDMSHYTPGASNCGTTLFFPGNTTEVSYKDQVDQVVEQLPADKCTTLIAPSPCPTGTEKCLAANSAGVAAMKEPLGPGYLTGEVITKAGSGMNLAGNCDIIAYSGGYKAASNLVGSGSVKDCAVTLVDVAANTESLKNFSDYVNNGGGNLTSVCSVSCQNNDKLSQLIDPAHKENANLYSTKTPHLQLLGKDLGSALEKSQAAAATPAAPPAARAVAERTPPVQSPANVPEITATRKYEDILRKNLSATPNVKVAVSEKFCASCEYGKTATENKQPFTIGVLHETTLPVRIASLPKDQQIDRFVNYSHTVDVERGGQMGTHVYWGCDGSDCKVVLAAPLDVRTNHVGPNFNSSAIGFERVAVEGAPLTDAEKRVLESLVKSTNQMFPDMAFVNHYDLTKYTPGFQKDPLEGSTQKQYLSSLPGVAHVSGPGSSDYLKLATASDYGSPQESVTPSAPPGASTAADNAAPPTKPDMSNCHVVGDSIGVGIKDAGCKSGCPVTSQNAIQVDQQINSNCSDLKNASVVILSTGCSSDGAVNVCKCPDPKTPCTLESVKKQVEDLNKQGVPSTKIVCLGVGPAYSDVRNDSIEQTCRGAGAGFSGALAKMDGVKMATDKIHAASPASYTAMFNDIRDGKFAAGQAAEQGVAQGTGDAAKQPFKNLFAGGRYVDVHQKVEAEMGLSGRGFPGILNGYAQIEGTFGDPFKCSPSGPCGHFQYSEATWRADCARLPAGTDCSLNGRKDPLMAAKVTASSIAYYDDKFGIRIKGSGINPYAGVYLLHNAGEGGGLKVIDAYKANPNTIASNVVSQFQIVNNPAVFGNGNITLAQVEKNILAGMNGSPRVAAVGTPPSTPPRVRGMNPLGEQSKRDTAWLAPDAKFGNPLTEGEESDHSTRTYKVVYGDNRNLSGSSGVMSGMGGMGIGNSLGSMFSNLFGGGNSANSNTQKPPPPPAPTVSIAALPNPVKRGQPIGVAWQSNGTSLHRPCQIIASDDGRVIASANGGSQSIPTSSSTPATLSFTATCFGVNGETVQQSASTTIQ